MTALEPTIPAEPDVPVTSLLHDDGFVALADDLQHRGGLRGRAARLVARARVGAARTALASRVVPALADLPHVPVTVPDTEGGRRLAAKYAGRNQGVPRDLAVSVLRLPEKPEDYLRGRSKQALRTNSRRAREQGVTCRAVDPVESVARLAKVVPERWWDDIVPGARADLEAGLCTGWIAEAADGATEVLALTSGAGPLARLDLMLTAPDRDGDSRYLLSAHVVTELAAAGTRLLAVDGALTLAPGLRHFQHLLGFGQATLDVQVA
ncbi:hypothetical protein LQ327_22990 [Actinomycetospora endophytica]|uniref:N-acetyltransferase domain-containing protein n=1 Tax=Actinomycetospora endophytica TaxID=2291215 RepID=A0ABS8PD92_9PSEU|nr:hypothetical protein [Actinomycetospora endophytica]MCD2196245.1 hypothetical protein [Actinomycetospora endophytica]